MDIKDIENKVKMISKFLSKESIDDNYEDIKQTVSEIITPTIISYVEIDRLFLFRARKLNALINFDNLSDQDIFMPPAELTEMGRGNMKSKPVLYAALDPVTAINETGIKENDYFLLGCFELLEKGDSHAKERTCVIGITKNDKKEDPMIRIAQGISSNFLYTEFTREITKWNKNRYYISNAIVDHLFNKMTFRSVIYPSVINNKRLNILLNEQAASDRLAFGYMYVCKMLEVNGAQFKAHIYKSLDSTTTKNELKWRNLENQRLFTYNSEGPKDQVEVIKKRMSKHFE